MNKWLLFGLLACLISAAAAQEPEPCRIAWPERPAEEEVTLYTLYIDNVNHGALTTTPVRMADLGVDESEPHILEVSATNASGEGPRSEPYQYTPVLELPGQVGPPTTSGC